MAQRRLNDTELIELENAVLGMSKAGTTILKYLTDGEESMYYAVIDAAQDVLDEEWAAEVENLLYELETLSKRRLSALLEGRDHAIKAVVSQEDGMLEFDVYPSTGWEVLQLIADDARAEIADLTA